MLHPCRYQRLVSLARTTRRALSADAHSNSASPSSDSIFTTSDSPWDHVFADIDTVRPLPPASARGPSRLSGRSAGNSSNAASNSSLLGRSGGKVRRQAMTAQEISAFDEMFNMIFNAVSDRQAASKSSSQSLGHQPPSIGPSSSAAPLNIFRTLRRHSSRVRWTTASDEELDRKKEEMELCDTDQELLEWAAREVFSESQKYVENAQKALEPADAGGRSSLDNVRDIETPSSANRSAQIPPLQPPTYPYLLAHLMKLFRTTYANPSLSLCIFTYASRLSIPSYVFGCTAPVYNELILAKWEGWADLPGICTALEEMRLNGVRGDGLTKSIIEKIRREVAEAQPFELGSTEVVRLLTRIEQLSLKETVRRTRSSVGGKPVLGRESWKTEFLDPETKDDGWEFDSWSRPQKSKGKKSQGRASGKRQEVSLADVCSSPQSADSNHGWLDLLDLDHNNTHQ
ncbi:hypothetical protein BKA82DRAFT_143570 [Pisolithus tinctorius]|uniref:Mtf2-like C-terminal domain-containing protein n=1 Tax=Pisolithus tinctorius Marx 270 TaxID=870435 RepID=A0A0C3K4J3_PISTI|nr:hypothetical protein BKA82DRAFT_143570 [Pisolithus tinctorius]KIO04487.1 hypothetical protein M404DRAFT_143570 [Pisolithus tinctorius Marx 270]